MPTSRQMLWWMVVTLLFSVAACALTWPVWVAPASVVLGHPRSDVWKHLWGDDWFMRELGSAFPVPVETAMLWAPDGGLLYNLDPLSGAVAALLGPIVGLVAAHNVAQVSGIVLAGWAGALLGTELTRDRASGLIAGAVFGFSAHLQAAVFASGIGETAHVGFVPLSVWATLRLLQGKRWAPVWLGLSLALSAIGSWYYGMVSSLVVSAVVAWGLTRLLASGASVRSVALGLGAAGVMAAVMVAPFAQVFLATFGEGQLHEVGAVGRSVSEFDPASNYAVATLRDFSVVGHRVQDRIDLLFFCNHIGFLVPALALVGAVRAGRAQRWVGVATLVALSLVLGPTIHLDRGHPLVWNPPFQFLQAVWPQFDMVRNLERLQVAGTLGLAVLASAGTAALFAETDWSRRTRCSIGLLMAAMVIIEGNLVSGLGVPLPTASVGVSPVIDRLAERGDAGAVIHLPISDQAGGQQFWAQVQHGRPLPMNLDGSPAPSLRDNRLMSALMPNPAHDRFFLDVRMKELSAEVLRSEAQRLREAGFTWILLDEGSADEPDLRSVLARCCGAPVDTDDQSRVTAWRLP